MEIDSDDPRPPYRQLADDLARRINTGELEPGQRLPSTRELMEQYGSANQTVQRALRLLRDEGAIKTVPSRGSFVVGESSPPIIGSPDLENPSAEYLALRDQLVSLAEEVGQIEARLRQVEKSSKRPTKKAAK